MRILDEQGNVVWQEIRGQQSKYLIHDDVQEIDPLTAEWIKELFKIPQDIIWEQQDNTLVIDEKVN